MATLLVGDASSNTHRVVDLTFAGQDIRVVAVHDGEQAVARIATDPPDIVLVNVAMPTRSGYDVCEYVKQTPALAHIPVLLLAGAFEPVDEARAPQVRWDGVVVKPFEPQHLAARVRELLAGRVGSPSEVVAGVPRAIERLGLRGAGANHTGQIDAAAPHSDRAQATGDEPNAIDHFHSEATLSDPALDEYFERLDTALSSRPAPLASLLPIEGPATGASAPPEVTDAGTSEGTAPERAAREHSDPGADVPTLDRVLSDQSTAGPVVTDSLIDEVTRRVVQRLSMDALDRAVADVVSEVAERLVRDEISRIRNTSPKPQVPSSKSQQSPATNESSNL